MDQIPFLDGLKWLEPVESEDMIPKEAPDQSAIAVVRADSVVPEKVFFRVDGSWIIAFDAAV